jgi:hypothetical protein
MLATALTMAGCGTQGPGAASQPGPVVSPSAAPEAAAGLAVGETATYSMLTHCGVESARINGRWWNAVTPLYGAAGEGAGAPAGWDNPFQEGRLTLETDDRAVFEALGEQVVLEPAPGDEPLRICR